VKPVNVPVTYGEEEMRSFFKKKTELILVVAYEK